ncbi:Zn-dependent hydrolase [Brevibacterium daeguense]|uniref:Zn-dependent hydrolase n=1 Tax=Brevibacterium daeguense TaxID=909936 RepID=A0ABP8EFD4_9MICO|nr:M20 family metallo-hydrolase [Brevibacterium daeguense]
MTTLTPASDRIRTDLEDLAALVDPDLPGWSRVALTEVDIAGRHHAKRLMDQAGLETTIDAAGNVLGRLTSPRSGGRTIMVGSHTDTVPGGGRFDGMVGVVAAIEVVRCLRESGTVLNHDLLVVDFFSEEPNRFGLSCVGSRALVGQITADTLALTDAEGGRFGDALAAAGIDAARITGARMDFSRVDAFIELHIEQGPYLEEHGSQIGLVERITGLSRFKALFRGQRDHGGTTPMNRRRDAGCAAAGTVLAVERIASQEESSRGTAGTLTFTPTAVNVVTEQAEMSGEFRSPQGEWLDYARSEILAAAGTEASSRGVDVDFEFLPTQQPVTMDSALMGLCAESVDGLGLSRTTLFSGAEHDAAIIATQVPAVMLFVPSQGGRSHCPEEWTDHAEVTAGVTALAHSIVAVDSAELPGR